MTSDVLRLFVADTKTVDVELKGEEARAISDRDLLETVVCLMGRGYRSTADARIPD